MPVLNSTSERRSLRACLHWCQAYWACASLRASWTPCSCSSGTSITNPHCRGGWRGPQRMDPCQPPLSHPASPPGSRGCFSIRTFLQFIQICGNIIILTKLALVPLCHLPYPSYPLPSLAGWLWSWGPQSPQFPKPGYQEHQSVHPIFLGECNHKHRHVDPIFLEFLVPGEKFLVQQWNISCEEEHYDFFFFK